MNNPICNLTTRASLSATAAHNVRWFAGLLAGAAALGLPAATAETWNGSVSSSWNDANNWTPATVPNGTNAIVNTVTPNFPVIASNLLFNPNDIIIGQGAGNTGRVDQTAGQVNTNAWMYAGVQGGTGTYNLTGSGRLNVNGRFFIGGSFTVAGGTGVVTVNTTDALVTSSDVTLGASGGTGTLNLDGGAINSGGWTFIGKREGFDGGNGTANISGGTWNHNGSRTYVGLGNSTGKLNLSGGTYNNVLGNNADVHFAVGVNNNANATTPEVNLTGGNLNVNRLLSVGGVAVEGENNDKNPDFQGPGKGKLTVNSESSVLNVTGSLWAGQGGGSNGQIDFNAGAINVGSWVAIGRGGGTGSFNMTGGTLTKTGSGNFIVGASGPGTMVQSGGLVDIQNGLTWVGELAGATTATLTINGTAEYRSGIISVGPRGPDAVLNLDGGTVRTNRFSGFSEDGGGFNTGNGTVNFNGSQIIASGNNAEFTRGVDTLNIAAGGMLVDTNGFTLTAPQPMSGPGGVVKSGAGSLALTGANSYTGTTVVNAGSLGVTTDATGGGAFTVADDAVLGLTQTNGAGVIPMSGLTLGNSSLTVSAADAAGNPAAAPFNVTGNLTLNGQVELNLVDEQPVAGLFPVISYAGKSGSGSFVIGDVPDGVVLNATTPVVDNGSVISLNIARANAPYWTGNAGSTWDTTAANWANGFTGSATTFANGDPVLFEDFFNTSFNKAVILNSTVIPGGSGVTVDNDVDDYSISGTGKISGTAGLTKRGFARLTLSNTGNDFTGPVVIEEGTVQVALLGNAGSPSPLGAGELVLAGGTLDYTGPATTTSRGFTIDAPANTLTSELILANNVTMSGAVTAASGKLRLSGAGVLTLSHAGPISLANGPGDANPASLVIDGGGLTLAGTGQTVDVTGNTQLAVVPFSSPVFTVGGDTVLNLNRLQIGFGTDSTPSMIIEGSATVNKLGGSWLSVGNSNNTNATLTVRDSGSLNAGGGDFNVSDVDTSKGTLNIEDNGSVSADGTVFIGKNTGTEGTLNMSGGTFNANGWITIGRRTDAIGVVNMNGGTINQNGVDQGIIVGENGIGTLNMNSGAVNIAGGGLFMTAETVGTGNATVNLAGGTITARRVAERDFHAGNVSTFNFDGGLLVAGANANADYMSNLDNAFVEDGGARVDTNGQDIVIAQPLLAGTTSGGGLTKSGAGTLQLNGTSTYNGTTTVTGGALGGTGSIAGPLVVESGAALAPGAVTGTFTAGQGVTFNAGSTFTVTIDDSQAADNGSLAVTGNLNLTGAALQVNVNGTPGAAPYTIATFGTRTGTFASVPAGVTVAYNANSITITPPALSPFGSWISGFDVGDLDGPTDDPDGDGQTNLEEFALDGNPASGAATGKIRSRIETVGGEQALVITFPVRSTTGAFGGSPGLAAIDAACDIRYEVLGSDDLAAFDEEVTEIPASAAGMPALSSEAWTYKSFRLDGAIGGAAARGPRGFLTVTVEEAP